MLTISFARTKYIFVLVCMCACSAIHKVATLVLDTIKINKTIVCANAFFM